MGHDVLTSHEAKRANQSIPDEEVLAFASQQGRAILTINCRDFKALHKKIPNHAGKLSSVRRIQISLARQKEATRPFPINAIWQIC
jgi:hypothetical protein